MADEITEGTAPPSPQPETHLDEEREDRRRGPRRNTLTHQVHELRQQLEEHRETLEQIKKALRDAALALNGEEPERPRGYHEPSERPQRNGGGYGHANHSHNNNHHGSHGRNPRGGGAHQGSHQQGNQRRYAQRAQDVD